MKSLSSLSTVVAAAARPSHYVDSSTLECNQIVATRSVVATSASSVITSTTTSEHNELSFPPHHKKGDLNAGEDQFHLILDIPRGGASSKSPNDDEPSKKNQSTSKPKKSKSSNAKKKKTNSSNENKSDPNTSQGNTPPIVSEILKSKNDYYKVLGVTKKATDREITKAYRKRAVQTHPDKTGGDRRAFDIVSEAYDVLSSEEKRPIYDRYGKAGIDSGMGSGASAASGFGGAGTFQDMFQNMFQQQQRQRSSSNRTMRYQLQVSLEDLYRGTSKTIRIRPPSARGMPHSHQQHPKEVTIDIPKGSHAGQKIVMSGAMDFDPKETPGDLIFIVTEAPHRTFTRKNHDLAVEVTITLEEALCGILNRPIRHLDGSLLWLQSAMTTPPPTSRTKHDQAPNPEKAEPIPRIIQTGDVQVLKGFGFPKTGVHDEYGDLYVQFKVELPKSSAHASESLTTDERAELRRLLAKLQTAATSSSHRRRSQQHPRKPESAPIAQLHPATTRDFGRASGIPIWEDDAHDPHLGDDEGYQQQGYQHPFGQGASTFFQQQFGQGGAGRSFYSFGGGNPFGGPPGGGPFEPDDDGNIQCQQM